MANRLAIVRAMRRWLVMAGVLTSVACEGEIGPAPSHSPDEGGGGGPTTPAPIGPTPGGPGPGEPAMDCGADPLRDPLKDGGLGPEMIPLPGGTFRMGSPPQEPERDSDEGPQREVRIAPFAIGRTEGSFDDYDLSLIHI